MKTLIRGMAQYKTAFLIIWLDRGNLGCNITDWLAAMVLVMISNAKCVYVETIMTNEAHINQMLKK